MLFTIINYFCFRAAVGPISVAHFWWFLPMISHHASFNHVYAIVTMPHILFLCRLWPRGFSAATANIVSVVPLPVFTLGIHYPVAKNCQYFAPCRPLKFGCMDVVCPYCSFRCLTTDVCLSMGRYSWEAYWSHVQIDWMLSILQLYRSSSDSPESEFRQCTGMLNERNWHTSIACGQGFFHWYHLSRVLNLLFT